MYGIEYHAKLKLPPTPHLSFVAASAFLLYMRARAGGRLFIPRARVQRDDVAVIFNHPPVLESCLQKRKRHPRRWGSHATNGDERVNDRDIMKKTVRVALSPWQNAARV